MGKYMEREERDKTNEVDQEGLREKFFNFGRDLLYFLVNSHI